MSQNSNFDGNELANTLANQYDVLKKELEKIQDQQRKTDRDLQKIKESVRKLDLEQTKKIKQLKTLITKKKKLLLTQTEIYENVQKENTNLGLQKEELLFQLNQFNQENENGLKEIMNEAKNDQNQKTNSLEFNSLKSVDQQFQLLKDGSQEELRLFQKLLQNESQLEQLSKQLELQENAISDLSVELKLLEQDLRIQNLKNYQQLLKSHSETQQKQKDQDLDQEDEKEKQKNFSNYYKGVTESNRLKGERVAYSLHLSKKNNSLTKTKKQYKLEHAKVVHSVNEWRRSHQKILNSKK
ncbi:hypothetical protein M0813_20011 [Anaeramoeba flamelloides]|uniref:Uncharacterized protein n=1 Tax=Anaeramoeba flamelloides TaxID=1746091 RepID=A0ABQ8YM19_9EUKA|nr:hypothetical protein M0813_20011 [Anaeramoeba flamelloides]